MNVVDNTGADSLRIDLLTISVPSLLGKSQLEILWGLNNAYFSSIHAALISTYCIPSPEFTPRGMKTRGRSVLKELATYLAAKKERGGGVVTAAGIS